MAVVFPLTPAPNQVVTDPVNNVTWRWDAPSQRWVPAATGATFVPLTGGTMQGPLALVGVTNGSNAAPGEVGEIIWGSPWSNYIGTDNGWGVSELILPPGRWLTFGGGSFDFDAAPANFGFVQATAFGDMTLGLSAGTLIPGGAPGLFRLEVGGGLVSISAVTNYWLNAWASFPGSCFISAYSNAIRMG